MGWEDAREKAPPLDSWPLNVREEGLVEEQLGKTNPYHVKGRELLLAFLFLRLFFCDSGYISEIDGYVVSRGGSAIPVHSRLLCTKL